MQRQRFALRFYPLQILFEKRKKNAVFILRKVRKKSGCAMKKVIFVFLIPQAKCLLLVYSQASCG